jgi:beta-glucosidase
LSISRVVLIFYLMKNISSLYKCFILLFILCPNIYGQIYFDPTAPIDMRVEDLLSRMTLQEKVGQMTQIERSTAYGNPDIIINLRIGSVLSGGGSAPNPNTPEAWADMYDDFQSHAEQTPLKIPLIYGIDAVHGHNTVLDAVIFPHNIGMGCTRNPELVEECARITALEVSATGIDWTFSPCIAVPRNERWGRTYEGFGETPALADSFARAEVLGYQSDSLGRKNSIVACAKHYIGDGGTTNGINTGNTQITEEELREIHLPGYMAAVNANVATVMSSYSSWNGGRCTGNQYLLTEILKGELAFKGFIVSDWESIGLLSSNYRTAIKQSINAGIDMAMLPYTYTTFISILTSLVNDGEVTMDRIDDAVRRILKAKFQMGLFEQRYTDRTLIDTIGCNSHRQVARQAVRESLVLLTNNGVLPLPKTGSRVLVAGSKANSIGIQCGGWTITHQGSSANTTKGTTLLQSIQQVQGETNVEYISDLTTIPDADIAVVAVGELPYAEGTGDRTDLSLSGDDIDLVTTLHNQGLPVVVIIFSGRPMIISDILNKADAIIAAWLPGTEAEGIADVIYGDYDFKGKLSHSWPASMSQIPVNWGDAEYHPLFPYGYGRTYSSSSSEPAFAGNNSDIKVFPIPADDYIYLKNLPKEDIQIDIVNLSGSIVLSKQLSNGPGTEHISIQNLQDGMYFIRIITEKSVISNKRIIKR